MKAAVEALPSWSIGRGCASLFCRIRRRWRGHLHSIRIFVWADFDTGSRRGFLWDPVFFMWNFVIMAGE